MTKEEIRNKILLTRANLSFRDKMKMDLAINQNLLKLIDEINPNSIHLFIPMQEEVDIVPTIMKLLKMDVTVVTSETLPKRKLNHWVLHSLENLVEGRFNTRHPDSGIPWEKSYDVIIVPGLAYTVDGSRIGYGGGYYDTFLQDHPKALKVGVCYDFQVKDSLPQESFDIKVNRIITNSGELK